MKTNNEFKLNGVTIIGICIDFISILTIVYGSQLYPIDFLDANFMSFLVGGIIGMSIGTFMISGLNIKIKQFFVALSSALLCVYVFILQMELIIKLITIVPIAGLGIWIIVKIGEKKKNIMKICKRCAKFDDSEIEAFCLENDYVIKYGCIGKCQPKNCKQDKYIAKFNKEIILAETKDKFFEQIINKSN